MVYSINGDPDIYLDRIPLKKYLKGGGEGGRISRVPGPWVKVLGPGPGPSPAEKNRVPGPRSRVPESYSLLWGGGGDGGSIVMGAHWKTQNTSRVL